MRKIRILLFTLFFLFFVAIAFSQSITVTSPNGGESCQIGTTHNITWNSNGVSGNIIIKLMKRNTMLGSIAWNIPNTGNYSWTINNIKGNSIQPGSDYKVLVRLMNDHSIQDKSNGNFNITQSNVTKTSNVVVRSDILTIASDIEVIVIVAPLTKMVNGNKSYEFLFRVVNNHYDSQLTPAVAIRVNGKEVWRKPYEKKLFPKDAMIEDLFLWEVKNCTGGYTIAIHADPENKIRENNKKNNLWRKQYKSGCPNLKVISCSIYWTASRATPFHFDAEKVYPSVPFPGPYCNNTKLICSIINDGEFETGEFSYGIFSRGQKVSLDWGKEKSLKPGEVKKYFFIGLAFKNQKLILKLDYDNLIRETNEKDNQEIEKNLCLF